MSIYQKFLSSAAIEGSALSKRRNCIGGNKLISLAPIEQMGSGRPTPGQPSSQNTPVAAFLSGPRPFPLKGSSAPNA
ncbi:hypothetical protein HMPREF0262_02919 [Clostridium sp. ATCC 29733]|nr:hypothetical protein HMPREF0262_02919 [Clostridium sp. ATCC 29733]